MSKNDAYAEGNRRLLAERKSVAINLISSPGSGKTTLLTASLNALKGWRPLSVIEGDLQTDNDAKRIASTGVAVHQINTEHACHLDAHMVGHAMEHLGVEDGSVVFIENVGNLVCPASFDLGENGTVVLLSVTEGDDKPAKYPVAFLNARALVITKTDLLDHVDFSMDRCRELALAVNPKLEIFEVSARTGEGIEEWCSWIRSLSAE
jgi:hydrogenase nickel incorporation protein HypB